MKDRPGWDGADDGGDLRGLLRHWTAPEPPADMEPRLRATFREDAAARRRRARAAVAAGLALAAGLVLAVAMFVRGPRGPARPPVRPPADARAGMDTRVAPPPPTPSEPPGAQETAGGSRSSGPAPARSGPRRPAPVVVEPGQRELLVALAREWRDARVAPPPASLPRVAPVAADAVERWEPMDGGWQRALPVDGGKQ